MTELDRSESTGTPHPAVDLGSAASFAVLAGSGITTTGSTTVAGQTGSVPTPTDADLSPVTCTGPGPGSEDVTRHAMIDIATAYSVAAGAEPSMPISSELGGMTLRPGIYRSTAIRLTGVWQVAGPVALAAGSSMIGTVLSSTAITASNAATVSGRLLVLDGGVALDANTVTAPASTPMASISPAHPHRRPALPVTARSAPSSPDDPSRLGDRRRQPPLDPGLLVGTTDAEILRSYVVLVRTWRGHRRRSARQPLALRAADVAILVAILGTDDAEIERRLVETTGCTPRAARNGRRLLVASAGALAIGLVTTSPLGLVTASPSGGTEIVAPTEFVKESRAIGALDPAAAPEAHGSLLADEVDQSLARRADTSPGTPVAPPPTVAPPAEVVPPSPEAVAPPVAPLPAGTDAMVTVASIGIELPVVPGGQSVIDQGVVAHYWAPGWEPAVAAGAPGTYWLAAHQSTHGGPFRTLPDVAIGAEVRVSAGDRTFIYTVTAKEVTGLYPGDDAVYGTDPAASTILLQTCIGNQRLLVRGTLTATL